MKDEKLKSKTINKVFIIALILSLAFFAFYYKVSTSKPDAYAVNYSIANIELKIPLAFHYTYYEKLKKWPQIKPGMHETSYIALDAVLPDIEAINEGNKYLFKELGWGEKIRIRLNSSTAYSLTRVFNSLKANNLLLVESLNLHNLEHFKLKRTESGDVYKDLFIKRKNDEIKVIVECGLVGSVSSPSCKVEQFLANNIKLEYVFSRSHLHQWKNIDIAVLNKLYSFCKFKKSCIVQL